VSSSRGEDTVLDHTPSLPPFARPPGSRVEAALTPGTRRFARLGPNHHLWRNGRFWWIAYTVIHDGWRQERIRHSLRTDDVVEARRRRDAILAQVTPGWREPLRAAS
jgi:hypothetical protein